MDVIHKIKVEDKTKIKNIHFKFPELMGKESIDLIKAEYKALLDAQDELYAARERVRMLEKRFANFKKEWDAKKDMFDIEFESTEKEVKTTKSYMTINGATVYNCNLNK